MTLRSILIVDDDENDQFICKYTVRKFDPGIEIFTAFDGTDALKVLSRETPDAIILDINMPVMNGFDFLAHYSAQYDNHASVVAMLTSSFLGKDRERALQYPFVKRYFEKPLQAEHLAVLRDLLDF